MSSVFIKVEALPGTDIRMAITESLSLVNILGFTVLLTFNGKSIYVDAHDSLEEIYNRWLKQNNKFSYKKD